MNSILTLLLFPSVLCAGNPNVGTTGFAFLKLPYDARSAALGGVRAALVGFSNPASLPDEPLYSISYGDYLADIRIGEAWFTRPFGGGPLGIKLFGVSYGEFRKVDRSGNFGGRFGAGDLGFCVAVARRLELGISLGVGFKAVYSYIAEYSSDAYASDLGLLWRAPWGRTSVGLELENMGFVRRGYKDRKDALPVALRLGFSHLLAHLPVVLVGDLVLPNDNSPYVSGGGEALVGDLSLRLGYDGRAARNLDGRYGGLSFGFGIVVRGTRLDYAYTTFGELGEVHRVSFKGKF